MVMHENLDQLTKTIEEKTRDVDNLEQFNVNLGKRLSKLTDCKRFSEVAKSPKSANIALETAKQFAGQYTNQSVPPDTSDVTSIVAHDTVTARKKNNDLQRERTIEQIINRSNKIMKVDSLGILNFHGVPHASLQEDKLGRAPRLVPQAVYNRQVNFPKKACSQSKMHWLKNKKPSGKRNNKAHTSKELPITREDDSKPNPDLYILRCKICKNKAKNDDQMREHILDFHLKNLTTVQANNVNVKSFITTIPLLESVETDQSRY
jgi:hypothetical protein